MSPGPAPWPALAVFLAWLALQRAAELQFSARNARRLLARGAVERGARHFPLFVVLHSLFPCAIAAEVAAGARPGPAWPLWLAVLLAAQALRWWSMRSLGERWTVRVIVEPGVPLIRRGPYRFFAHPCYVAVTLELAAAPLLFGAVTTAVAVAVLNAAALAIRLRCENAALAESGPSAPAT